MGFNVDGLTNYVQQNRLPILTYSSLGVDTRKLGIISEMPNVKNIANLNIMSDSASVVDRACGWNPTGNTTFSARQMVVRRAMIQKEWCMDDLYAKWLGDDIAIRATANHPLEDEKFGADLVNAVIEQANEKIELGLWQGTAAGEDKFDGFLAIAATASASTLVATTTGDTVCQKVQKLIAALPAPVLRKAAVFMSLANFNSMCAEILKEDYNHYTADLEDSLSITFPGTRIKVYAVDGLDNKTEIFACDPKNLYYGYDLTDDERAVASGFEEKQDKWWLKIAFNYGAQIAFPDKVRYTA